jgi:branched-chain amino acid transport system ATP-binding protein
LNTVELQSYEQVPATSLSYGQQKLLALARCIATNSGWIILDEPVSGVALPLVESLISMIRRLSTEGRSVVFIEHDIQAVRALADVVVVLDQGRVVISGPTNDVLERSDLLEAYLGR